MGGDHPMRPGYPDFTEPLWTLTQRCWEKEPQDRPAIEEVIRTLEEPSAFNWPRDHRSWSNRSSDTLKHCDIFHEGGSLTLSAPDVNGDVEAYSDSQSDVMVKVSRGFLRISLGNPLIIRII